MSVRPPEQIELDQPAVLNQLIIFHWHSNSSYTQEPGHIEHFATLTTSTSQFHILCPLQSSYLGLVVGLTPLQYLQ